MAKRAYIVLALSEAELTDFIKQGDPAKALKTLQPGQRALFFADFLPAQQFCAMASLPKFEYSKKLSLDGRSEMSVIRKTNEKGEAIFEIKHPRHKSVSIQLGQTLSIAEGGTMTLKDTNFYSDEDQAEHDHFSDFVDIVHRLPDGSILTYAFMHREPSNVDAREYATQFKGPHFNAPYEMVYAKVEHRFDHLRKESWHQGFVYAPGKKMVIAEVEVEHAVDDQKPSSWFQEESFCIITPRAEPIHDTSQARYFYLEREQEKLLNGQRLAMRYADAHKILGISRLCYTNNNAWYWSETFSPALHKLDLLRDLVQHFAAGQSDHAKQDLAAIKKHVKFSEIHHLFNELAKELTERERSVLPLAQQIVVNAFLEEQVQVESRWRIAYWLTAGMAWGFRKLLNLFWSDVPASIPREAIFKVAEVQQGMRDFYQHFRNARHLGYEKRADNVVTHYANPTNFSDYLKEKARLNVFFNRKGELNKQIIAHNLSDGSVRIRGNGAQIERWELLTSFGKLSREKQDSRFEWYKARLEKSKLDSQAMVRNHHYRPQL